MTKIQILDEETANQIAAGEVIDRPAAVVKELVENSIDAGSTIIRIRVEDGGITKIQVVDDGIGMSRRDCELAFCRHGTSKIRAASDLLRISTLGFRGEALPSIAAVSKVRLVSRPKDALEGTLITLEGGKRTNIGTIGCPAGTEVTVEELFFNTPARKKYLKKPATEASHVISAVHKLALAYPDVSFQLWHNGQHVLATSGSGVLKNTLVDLFGLDFIQNMVEVHYRNEYMELTGFAGKSFFHRSNREQEFFIVNGRVVKSPVIQVAVEDAYRSLLPSRRYPVAVICLKVSPEEVDVNVHPAKLEVKFAEPDKIVRGITIALNRALQETNHIPTVTTPPDIQQVTNRIERVKEAVDNYLQTQLKEYIPKPSAPIFQRVEKKPAVQLASTKAPSFSPAPDSSPGERESFPELVAIGQLHDSFILAQGAEGLYIIDQHGAHERIHYEALLEELDKASCESQGLAIPVTLELNPVDRELLISRILLLAELGIIIEHFGKNTFLIRAVPLGFTGDEIAELVWEIIHTDKQQGIKTKDMRETIVKMLACKKSIKSNDRLSLVEQQTLLDKLAQLKQPFTCPHGRPIIISLSMKELRRRFGRG